MSTKTLLLATTILVFLAGWAFGYSLGDIRRATKLLPASEREQALYDKWQAAKLTTTGPGDNFRVAVSTAAHDYVFTLSEAVRAVVRGGDAKIVAPATDARVVSIVAPFESILTKQLQAQHLQLWKSITSAMYDYGAAKVSDDPVALKTVSDVMTASTAQLAQFYTTLGVQMPVTTLQAGLSRAILKLEKSIDETSGGSLVMSLESEQQAAHELGSIMDVVTSGIVKANPKYF